MKPLFGSCVFDQTPPELRWSIPDEYLPYAGKVLFLAGPPVALVTHRVGYRTLPCLNALPKLGMECPHCDRRSRKTVWVPVVTTSAPFTKLVFMGGEATYESVKGIPAHTLIAFHYAKVIKPTIVFGRQTLQLGLRQVEEIAQELHTDRGDITRWLLHYWQWPTITQAFGEAYRESAKVKLRRERTAVTHNMQLLGHNPEVKAG